MITDSAPKLLHPRIDRVTSYYRPGAVYRDLPDRMPKYKESRWKKGKDPRRLNTARDGSLLDFIENFKQSVTCANAGKLSAGRASSPPCQARVPFPGDQEAIWIHQGALLRSGQKLRPGADTVCAVQSVDGPRWLLPV